ncbi:MAG TPA: alpha/beta hydrolase [Mesorhizobium sp.]
MMISVERGAFVRSFGTGRTILCLHGFGDNGSMFLPLEDTDTAKAFSFVCPDIPGMGASPLDNDLVSVDDYAKWLIRVTREISIFGPVGLVAHSAASPVAVRAIELEPDLFCGLFSIEGNLTENDAFFSGKAADYDDPELFKAALLKTIWRDGEKDKNAGRFYSTIAQCDAQALWRFGRLIKSIGAGAGRAFVSLAVPRVYYWSRTSTNGDTRAFIESHRFDSVTYDGGHMPTLESPDETANAIAKFFEPAFEACEAAAA